MEIRFANRLSTSFRLFKYFSIYENTRKVKQLISILLVFTSITVSSIFSIPAAPALVDSTNVSTGPQIRTLRLALALTSRAFNAGILGSGVTDSVTANAKLQDATSTINSVFERELGIRLILVSNNASLVFTENATDPFLDTSTAWSSKTLPYKNMDILNNRIGSSAYDIGHVIGSSTEYTGGFGSLGGVWQFTKGVGASVAGGVVDRAFWVGLVAHELGHQLGARHSMNGSNGACYASFDSTDSSTVEIGSGSSIMAYPGSCDMDNLITPNGSGEYFHAHSYQQIRLLMQPSSVGTNISTGNSAPVINLNASTYTIPQRTPFLLSGTATDADANTITYTWEQMDPGTQQVLLSDAKTSGPLFRSRIPTTSGSQSFPPLSNVLEGTTNAKTGSCSAFSDDQLRSGQSTLTKSTIPRSDSAFWFKTKCYSDFLPTNDRAMRFRLTARDGVSGVSSADVNLTVTGSTPFAITSHNSTQTIAAGSTQTLTWNTAGTESAPYNSPTVDILYSTDSGTSWSGLKSGTLNDGSETFLTPNTNTSSGAFRLMVRSVGNIFYDVNTAGLTINGATAAADTSLTFGSFANNIYKGISFNITVTASSPGKIRFFANGKRISTCLAVTTTQVSPFIATCAWKSPYQNQVTLTANFTSTNGSNTSATAGPVYVLVKRRINTR